MADDVTQTTGQDPVQDDVQSQTSTQTQGTQIPGGDQQNPLDVLEKLLDEIDQGKTAGTKPKPVEPAGPTPEEIAAQEQEQRRLEFEQKQAEQQIIDQQKIEQQRKALEDEMANGTANLARASQDEKQKTEKSEKIQADEGFEIVQLDHTKI